MDLWCSVLRPGPGGFEPYLCFEECLSLSAGVGGLQGERDWWVLHIHLMAGSWGGYLY